MSGDRKLKVEILGDGSGAERALGDVAKKGEESGGRLSSALSNAMGQLGLPFTGALDSFGNHLDGTGAKAKGFGSKVSGVARDISLATVAGLGAAAVACTDLAMNYQQTDGKIAASAGISINAATKIGDGFLSMGTSTTFSGQQVATAYAAVAGQLGNTEGHALTAGQALEVMRASTDLAEASGSSLGSATSDLSTVMQAYGIRVQGAGQASDELFNAANITGQGLDQVTNVTQRLHSQLGVLAPNLSDTASLMVDLTKHGETGRAAVSGVSSAFSTLLGNSKPVDKAIYDLGIHTFDSSGKFVGMGSVMAQLQPKLAGMTQAQQILAMQTLFGKGAADKMLTTVLAGPAAFDAASAAVNRSGSAHEAAGRATDNLRGNAEKLKAGMLDLGTKVGEALIPKIQSAIAVTNQIVQWFEKNRGAAEALGIAVGVVLGGALLIYVTNLTIAAAKSAIQFGQMIVKAGLWVAAEAVSVAQSASLWLMYAGEWISETSGNVAAWLALHARAAATWVAETAVSIARSVALWAMYGAEWLATSAASAARWLAQNVTHLAEIVAENVTSAAATVTTWVTANAAIVASAVAAYVAENAATLGIIAVIALLVGAIVFLATHWHQVWTDVKNWTLDAWHFIKPAIQPIIDIIKDGLIVWIRALQLEWKIAWSLIKDALNVAWSIMRPVFNFIKSVIANDLTVAIQGFKLLWNTAWPVISGAVSTAWNIVKPVFNFVKTVVGTDIKQAIQDLKDAWNIAWSAISGAVSAAWSIISPIFDAIKSAASWLGSAISAVTGGGGSAPAPAPKPKGGTPHRATGGPVKAGFPYIINEVGKEGFVPDVNGTIIPHNKLALAGSGNGSNALPGSGQSTTEINVNVQTNADPHEIASELAWAMRTK
jgi:TP901 family phage tail tape measure protein